MDDDPKLSILELIILSLTVYTIFSILIQLVFPVSEEMMKLLNLFEWICSGFFIYEWRYRYVHSENKKEFLKYNFIDLIASFPIGFISGLKALRLLRILQVIKIFGSITRFRTYVKANKVHFLKMVLFSGITLLMMISPVLILFFEEESGNINSADDCLWYTFTTITSIGYGNVYCVTAGGRIVTVVMTIAGMGLFSLFSGLIVNFIITKAKED